MEQKTVKKSILLKTLYEEKKEDFKLEIVVGEDFLKDTIITSLDVHRPGLSLAGFTKFFLNKRIQIFGKTEMSFLKEFDSASRTIALTNVYKFHPPAIIISESQKAYDEMLELSLKYKIPILRTSLSTTPFIHLLTDYLDLVLAEELSLHGTLVDVYGVGLFITGKSGIGKSETALDLIERGHRLISDDTVRIIKRSSGLLIGTPPQLPKELNHYIEIRGLGLLDIFKMFGIRSTRMKKKIEIQINLISWNELKNYDRIGLEEAKTTLMGIEIPVITVPVLAGRNIALICEVVALNHLLKIKGIHAAKIYDEVLKKAMKDKRRPGDFLLNKDDIE